MKKKLRNIFTEKFQTVPTKMYFSPGKVNLLGDQLGYSGGHVLACALSFGIYAVVAPRKDKTIRLYSENFPHVGVIEFTLENLTQNKESDWGNYVKAILLELHTQNIDVQKGFDVAVYGNIPTDSELSSSSSLKMLVLYFLNDLFSLNLDELTMIDIANKVSHQFRDIENNIIDPFVITKGKKNNAILLNKSTLFYEYVPIEMEDYVFIITNTKQKENFSTQVFKDRRLEEEMALSSLSQKLDIKTLDELSVIDFQKNKDLIKTETVAKRVHYLVTENNRVLKAREYLQNKDLLNFAQLITKSEFSLRDDYEITGSQIDILIDKAMDINGVLSARLMGYGLNGCILSMIKRDVVSNFKKEIEKICLEILHTSVEFYLVEVGDGVRALL